jgi:hypothetical protein
MEDGLEREGDGERAREGWVEGRGPAERVKVLWEHGCKGEVKGQRENERQLLKHCHLLISSPRQRRVKGMDK